MKRIVSCFTNCYGAAGVWTAVERIRETGHRSPRAGPAGSQLRRPGDPRVGGDHRESRRRRRRRRFATTCARHGVKISGCNVGGADIRTREGVELTERRIRFAARWFGVTICVSGAGQPADAAERRTIVDHLRRLGDTAGECGVTLALETHKGPTQNAAAMLALMERGRSSPRPAQLRYRQHRLLQPGRRPVRRARAGQAPGPERPSQGQSRRLRRLVLPGRRRRRQRRFRTRPGDPRRRGLRRPLHDRDRRHRRRARAGSGRRGTSGSRGACEHLRALRLLRSDVSDEESDGSAWESNPPGACLQTPHWF